MAPLRPKQMNTPETKSEPNSLKARRSYLACFPILKKKLSQLGKVKFPYLVDFGNNPVLKILLPFKGGVTLKQYQVMLFV